MSSQRERPFKPNKEDHQEILKVEASYFIQASHSWQGLICQSLSHDSNEYIPGVHIIIPIIFLKPASFCFSKQKLSLLWLMGRTVRPHVAIRSFGVNFP